MSDPTAERETCHSMDDGVHCRHWWDGGPCCACGASAMPDAQRIEYGMPPQGCRQGCIEPCGPGGCILR